MILNTYYHKVYDSISQKVPLVNIVQQNTKKAIAKLHFFSQPSYYHKNLFFFFENNSINQYILTISLINQNIIYYQKHTKNNNIREKHCEIITQNSYTRKIS